MNKDVEVVEQLEGESRSFEGPGRDPNITLVTWDGPDDPQNPYNWPLRKKWATVVLALLITLLTSPNGTIISVAHQAINDEFGIHDGIFPHSYWPITSWGVGGALFPLVLFPLMEDFGVRKVLIVTYFVFTCFLIPLGTASNFATLIVTRFFAGGCVQLLGNAVGGVVSNVFPDDRARTIPITLYIVVYFSATSLGPVIGASIFQFLSWRWIGYIELIWTATFFPVLLFFLPESRDSVILKAKAKALRRKGEKAYTAEELHHEPLSKVMLKSIQRPLYMLGTEPVVIVAALWAAFSLGTIYLFTQAVEQVYSSLYGWDAVQAGYVQAAIVVGDIFGLGLCLCTNHWYYNSAARNTEVPGTPIPEARLYTAVIGGFFGVSGGMFVYAWTSYPDIHWMAPTVGLAMTGCGVTSVITSIANYLIDAYSKYAGSALGAVGFVENLSLAFIPLASTAMYTNLDFHWASSLLGFLSLALVVAPFMMLKWGAHVRARSPFMKEAIIDQLKDGGSPAADMA